jgi:pimeloyl-ACP methyl ester carboxylesterase
MDGYFMAQPHRPQIQLELLYDYRHNLARYPEFQTFLRQHRPPVLIVWGEQDPYFTVAGARAYLRDQPDAELHLLPAGHFALEEELATIATQIRAFYANVQARAVSVGT